MKRVLCVLALLLALALAEGGEKVQDIIENEIGERVREAREKDMKDNDPFDRVVALKFELGGQKTEGGEFYEKV